MAKKIITISWSAAILVLTGYYSGCLLSELTIPDSDQIANIWEFWEKFHSGQILMVGSRNLNNLFKEVIILNKNLYGYNF